MLNFYFLNKYLTPIACSLIWSELCFLGLEWLHSRNFNLIPIGKKKAKSVKIRFFLHFLHAERNLNTTQDIWFQRWPFCSQKNAQFCLKFSLLHLWWIVKKKYFVEEKFICESLKLVSNTKENRAKLLFLLRIQDFGSFQDFVR